jgi:hypothetical protein
VVPAVVVLVSGWPPGVVVSMLYLESRWGFEPVLFVSSVTARERHALGHLVGVRDREKSSVSQ